MLVIKKQKQKHNKTKQKKTLRPTYNTLVTEHGRGMECRSTLIQGQKVVTLNSAINHIDNNV